MFVNSKHMKSVYAFSCIVLCVIFLMPTLAITLPALGDEKFSVLWLLGPAHMMEGYPHNVVQGENYQVFLGVANQMGELEYYLIRVKLANQSEPLPDNSAGTPSSLPDVYEYRLFLQNNATWEINFSFSLNGVSFEGNTSMISIFSIDGHVINVNKIAMRDAVDNGFHYELFFELWIYNSTSSTFQYHDRFVGFLFRVAE
jgi:hypothetical protein